MLKRCLDVLKLLSAIVANLILITLLLLILRVALSSGTAFPIHVEGWGDPRVDEAAVKKDVQELRDAVRDLESLSRNR